MNESSNAWEVTLSAHNLSIALRAALHSAGGDRANLQAVRLIVGTSQLQAIGTDEHRLTRLEVPVLTVRVDTTETSSALEGDAVLPIDRAKHILSVLTSVKHERTVTLARSGCAVSLSDGPQSCSVPCRESGHGFPPHEKVIPSLVVDTIPRAITVSAQYLAEACALVKKIAPKGHNTSVDVLSGPTALDPITIRAESLPGLTIVIMPIRSSAGDSAVFHAAKPRSPETDGGK